MVKPVPAISNLHCRYRHRDGSACMQAASKDGLCYWHDSSAAKQEAHLSERLRELVDNGYSLEGYSLKRAHLKDLNLVQHGSKQGVSLKDADLYRADLEGAHLFHADFENASLMKANLSNANLHCANLVNCNLLGVILTNARIENVQWGDQLVQEKRAEEARKQGDLDAMRDYLEQAEEIYRNLRKAAEMQGLFEISGRFFYQEMVVRRRQLPALSFMRCVSKLVDLFCGYGEKPLRVVLFSLALIGFCALSFFALGISHGGQIIVFQQAASVADNTMAFLQCLYFSVVTFTTLGYGDIVPVGAARPVAALEAFTGNFTIALFVVVFVKKMTR